MNLLRRPMMAGAAAPSLRDQVLALGIVEALYDITDLSSLFQDAAQTTAVTAAADPVGAVLDLTGNGHHLTQATSSQRPAYQLDGSSRPYIVGDAVDDYMSSNNIDLTGTDAVTIVLALRKTSDSVSKTLYSINGFGNQSILAYGPQNAGVPGFTVRSRGTALDTVSDTSAAPITCVLTAETDISAPYVRIRIDGAQTAASAVSQGTGNYANVPLDVMARSGSGESDHWLYGMAVIPQACTAPQLAVIEAWAADLCGVTL